MGGAQRQPGLARAAWDSGAVNCQENNKPTPQDKGEDSPIPPPRPPPPALPPSDTPLPHPYAPKAQKMHCVPKLQTCPPPGVRLHDLLGQKRAEGVS